MAQSNGRPLTAGELYALSQGEKCEGPDECHWCAAPCERKWPHDDPPPLIGFQRKSFARRPGNGFVCAGCRLWRRQRITIEFLGGGLKDIQTPENWSWLVTGGRARALRPKDPADREALYEKLLSPPGKFFLALRASLPVTLQLAEVNQLEDGAEAGTPLKFTLDNKPLTYTVYELEHALKNGPEGTEPGVRLLVETFGLPVRDESPGAEAPPAAAKKKRGRPFTPTAEDNPVTRKLDGASSRPDPVP